MARPFWQAIPGRDMQDAERKYLRLMAARTTHHFEDPFIVNIGVKGGTSLHCLCIGAPDAHFLAIDIDLAYYPIHRPEMLPAGIEFVEADSATYPIVKPVHLVFVDGGHLYREVQGDICNWIPHVVVGGLAIFHDYAPNNRDARRLEGVSLAIDEWWESVDNWQRVFSVGSLATFRRIA